MIQKDDSQKNDPIVSQDSQEKVKELSFEDMKNALARALADLQNMRRRTEEERGKWIKVAYVDLLREILPILDHFDRSAEHLPEDLKGNEWAKGVIQIHDDLTKTLDKLGIKKIETVGKKVDPNFHHAMMAVPGEKDIVIQEFEAGYLLDDLVIKPAKVSVGNGEKTKQKSVDSDALFGVNPNKTSD